jgi:hypothetical protein
VAHELAPDFYALTTDRRRILGAGARMTLR